MAKTKRRKSGKALSPAQRANQERFAAMARARAGKSTRRVGSSLARPSGGSRGSSGIVGNIVSQELTGLIDAAYIIGGKVSSRAVPALLKLDAATPTGMAMTLAAQLGAGLAVAMLARQFLGADAERMILAGATVGVAESALRKFEVPYLSTLVGDEGDVLGGYTYEVSDASRMYPGGGPGIGLYPSAAAGMGLYPGSMVGSYVFE